MEILDKIKSINDIKNLRYDELSSLAKEVRELIIDSTSVTGGHLASSLGVVELTIALILAYDFPKDKIIWDVGHQSYAYKILTDRKDAFSGIRSYGGISGFPKRNESEFDSFDTGHSSTSISAGMGMCVARDLKGEKNKIVTVIGDGALTGGMAFEALNNLSELKSNYVIVLNDNEMSISKSRGGLNKALLGIRTSASYSELKKKTKALLEKSEIGAAIKNILVTLINMIKQVILSDGMFFENLNINYVGPIDGHDISKLFDAFVTARNSSEPVLIHVKTIKGKGYKPAEINPTKFHGISSFDKDTGEELNKINEKTYTKIFSDKICELASKNNKIVTITAAMRDGTGLTAFSKKFPERFFDVEICEQHAVTFAAGLAVSGMIPVVCIYSSFLQRGFDQIIHDVCLQNQHVVFMIDRAGLVGADGETHQGIFDISYLRLIPNMIILAPKNSYELEDMLEFAIYDCNSPIAIRYPRGIAYTECSDIRTKISLGKSEIVCEGKDIVFFAIGSMVSTAIHLREKLSSYGIDVGIINVRFAKPLDLTMIDQISIRYGHIVVMEENVKSGGIGQEVASYITKKGYGVKLTLITLPDAYVEHGDVSKLREVLGIDSDSILKKLGFQS